MSKFNPADLTPADGQDALRIFDERYVAGIGVVAPQGWVDELGDVSTTPALSTKYPIGVLSLKYQETIAGEGRFKTIGQEEVELTVVEYDDGVEVELIKAMTNPTVALKWAQAPSRLIDAEQKFRMQAIATMLGANTEVCGWDGLTLFHDAHLSNPKDANSTTFDNLQATTKDVLSIDHITEEFVLMTDVLDENGDPLGLDPDTLVVSRKKFRGLKNLLAQQFIATSAGTATMTNPYTGNVITVVRADQLPNDLDWFIADSKLIAKGVVPWVQSKLQLNKPGFDQLGLRRFDENSDHFKKTGKVAVSSHVWYGQKFLFPHALRKVAGA